MPLTPSALLGGVALALILAVPASAADFYVDDNGAGPPTPGCQSQSFPCPTINTALTASRALAGTGDTINVAPGTYDEDVVADQPSDNGLSIVGSGSVLNPTKIQHVSNAQEAVQLGATSAPLNTDVTMHNVTVVVPAGSGSSKSGILMAAVGGGLQDVLLNLADPASTGGGLEVIAPSGINTIDHVVLSSKSSNGGLLVAGGATTNVTRSGVVMTNTGSNAGGIALLSGTVHISDSIVRLPSGSSATDVGAGNAGSIVLDSSLVEGGRVGVLASEGNAGTTTALVRRSTVDVGTPGIDDGALFAAALAATTSASSGAVATTTVADSLIVDGAVAKAQAAMGTPSISCSNSLISPSSVGPVTCGAGGGNSASDPVALFVDPANLDYRLKPDSPAIDTGSASGPAAGEPSIDFAGNPRSVDGNFDCVARPDLGAYELQGQSDTPPSPMASGPAAGAQGEVLHFSADATDAEDPAASLTYAWAFTDGGTGTGATVQHAFTQSGAQTATVTVTDTHGCTGTAQVAVDVAAPPPPPTDTTPVTTPVTTPEPPPADTTPPVISKASVKKRRLRLTLSEPATVKIAIARRSCRTAKGRRRCAYRIRRRLTLAGVAGANAARLPAKAKLPAGSYRVALVATDAAANHSPVKRLRVRL